MRFGIMFFSSAAAEAGGGGKYGLLLDAARYADERGFCAVWTPERHFHEFGGLFPNPSVVGAALAVLTRRVQLRAGSLISPLHDAVRIAEEWSVVDNLSGGRAAVSFGSGWNVDDFVFFPERYPTRHALMYEQIETVRRLWRGEPLVRANTFGKEVEIRLHPRPVQEELPVWVTSSGNAETFESAGAVGANLLTHLIGQNVEALAGKIERYRAARASHGHEPGGGTVTLMLHTFMGPDADAVRAKVRRPFREYLRSAISLEEKAAAGGGTISGGHKIAPHDIPPAVMEELLDLTFERYYRTAALMGTTADCLPLVRQLEEAGVDEVACLIDFLDDAPAILESLTYVDQLRAAVSAEADARAADEAVNAFMEDLEV
ncbi:MAG TPA: MupA/Atu3671 family FMN-dependent luciferase-like monooxygenase [Pyrinomonadaceae bacterium]|jgi:natural product biosynthesis luciferase-like monooxygenase protein